MVLMLLFCLSAEAVHKPNIVFILADDIGYGDLGCYGATRVKTPNLDALAARGLRFTDAHSPSSMCSPTRYALMTGRYAWRNTPTARGVLSGVAPLCIVPGSYTLPSMLQKQGYATGVVGKWHLGLGAGETDYNTEIKPGAREVGFDYSFLIPATGDRVPCVYVENGRVAGLDPKDPIRVSYGKPIGDEPTGKARPDLLTMKPSLGHADTIVNGISRIGFMTGGKAARWKDEDMADDLTKKAVGFIERSKTKPFFLYFATHDSHVPRVPHPRFAGKSAHGTRGDTIEQLDWCVGELMKTLDRHGLSDNTIIVFSSDNGGVMDDGYIDGTATDKSGHRCNGVLRGFKVGLYEGGHRVPMLVRWPAQIKPGVRHQLACLADWSATLASVVGAKLDEADAPDSFDLSKVFRDPDAPGRAQMVMHSGGGVLAYREGPWKLVPPHGPKAKGKATELFHLADDLSEKNNLASREPERVKAMEHNLEVVRKGGRSR
ncbi:MAG: arylsulfatase [Planctomycetia bacterium]|nr:arylsulfatase [Planctomycetia bacterium]